MKKYLECLFLINFCGKIKLFPGFVCCYITIIMQGMLTVIAVYLTKNDDTKPEFNIVNSLEITNINLKYKNIMDDISILFCFICLFYTKFHLKNTDQKWDLPPFQLSLMMQHSLIPSHVQMLAE